MKIDITLHDSLTRHIYIYIYVYIYNIIKHS